jgi:hypothetical protein
MVTHLVLLCRLGFYDRRVPETFLGFFQRTVEARSASRFFGRTSWQMSALFYLIEGSGAE